MKKSLDITPDLEPLFGTRDENLRLMEDSLKVSIDLRSDAVHRGSIRTVWSKWSRFLPIMSVCAIRRDSS